MVGKAGVTKMGSKVPCVGSPRRENVIGHRRHKDRKGITWGADKSVD